MSHVLPAVCVRQVSERVALIFLRECVENL